MFDHLLVTVTPNTDAEITSSLSELNIEYVYDDTIQQYTFATQLAPAYGLFEMFAERNIDVDCLSYCLETDTIAFIVVREGYIFSNHFNPLIQENIPSPDAPLSTFINFDEVPLSPWMIRSLKACIATFVELKRVPDTSSCRLTSCNGDADNTTT